MSRHPWIQDTAIGVVGTVGRWHRWAPGYSLGKVEELVRRFRPDLVCAEILPSDWEAGRMDHFPPEYQGRLIPLCRSLSITIVPVGNRWPVPPSPLRLALLLGAGPHWLNSPAADRWHQLWARPWPQAKVANHELVAAIAAAIRRDPGRRVLVTVRWERRYAVAAALKLTTRTNTIQISGSDLSGLLNAVSRGTSDANDSKIFSQNQGRKA